MESSLQAEPIDSHKTQHSRQKVREVLTVLFFNTIICTLVAVFVWLVTPSVGQTGLLGSWVYSQSIGQSICIGSLVFSHYMQKRGVESRFYFIVGHCLIVPLGFLLGKTIAATILSGPAVTPKDGHLFWTTLLVTVLVSLFSILFYSTWQHVTTLKLKAAEESARASTAKLSMLQAQVEPHMLFNTLSNLRSLIDSDPSKAQHMLDHLVDYLRATLAGSQHRVVTLSEEFELLENYLSLMEIRMGDRLSFDLGLPEALKKMQVPIMILQPIVENAIKHGLEPAVDGGSISVHARSDDNFVAIDILDTGVGYNSADQSLSSGFGLQSVRERLQLVKTNYEVLSISSPPENRESGTKVTVRLPLPKRSLSA